MLFKKFKKQETNKNINVQKLNIHENIEDNVTPYNQVIMPEALLEYNDYMYLGNGHYIRTLAMSLYPSDVYIGWLDELFDVADIDITIYNTAVPNDLVRKKLTRKSVKLQSQYNAYRDNGDITLLPQLQEAIQDIEDERYQIQTNKDKMFYVTIIIKIHANSKEQLETKTSAIKDILSKRYSEVKTLSLRQLEGLQCSLPIGHTPLDGFDRNITSYGLSTLFPISNPSVTHTDGFYLGRNYFTGAPVLLNPFSDELLNPHICVFGITGSGKSVCLKSMANKAVGILGLKGAIIDPEGEYEDDITRLMGETYINLKTGQESGINIFEIDVAIDNKGVEYVPINDKVIEIKALLSAITRYSMQRPLTAVEQALVEKAVIETYKEFGITSNPSSLYVQQQKQINGKFLVGKVKKTLPTLSDFYKQLKKYEKAQELSIVLHPYLKGNSMGMFDCQSRIPMDINLIGFNLSSIDDEFTKFYCSFVLFGWLWQNFALKYRDTEKFILFDETWVFLKYPESANFLATIARRGRKYKTALWCASQFLNEFLASDEGLAIINSCSTHIILNQLPQVAEQAVKQFHLADGAAELLTTFDKGECIFQLQNYVTAIKIEPIPYEWDYIRTD